MLINEDGWCAPYNMLDVHFNLETAETAMLIYWLNQALEPGYDSLWVEVSTDGTPGSDPNDWMWTQAAPTHQELCVFDSIPERPWDAPPINKMLFSPWKRFIVSLDDYCGETIVHFRFHISSDKFIEEDGVYIDDVLLLASNVTPPEIVSDTQLPGHFELGKPYPNPFNGRLNVTVYLPDEGSVKLVMYDVKGRQVLEGGLNDYPPGSHILSIDASNLPSGLYLLRGSSEFGSSIKKVLLIK